MPEPAISTTKDRLNGADLGETLVRGPVGTAFFWIHRAVETFVVALFVAIVLVAVMQVVNRFFLGRSLSWSEEFQRYGHIWLVFLAVPIGYRRGAHIGVDFLQSALRGRKAEIFAWVLDLAWLALGVVLIVSTSMLMGVAWRQHSPGVGWTMDKVYLGLLLGGVYLSLAVVDRLLQKVMGTRTA
ncbi:MAG: TRAP transporter small permease [Rhizobiaceae bacterium]|nr:TRAP transporter small permease [Rhizobiaceae bacterium]